jgi:hypothetical protein
MIPHSSSSATVQARPLAIGHTPEPSWLGRLPSGQGPFASASMLPGVVSRPAGKPAFAGLARPMGGVLYVGKSMSLPSIGGCKTWKGIAGLCGSVYHPCTPPPGCRVRLTTRPLVQVTRGRRAPSQAMNVPESPRSNRSMSPTIDRTVSPGSSGASPRLARRGQRSTHAGGGSILDPDPPAPLARAVTSCKM